MGAMDQEVIRPDKNPPAASQAFSPLGCFIAASGVTLMVFCMLGAAMAATVWAFSALFGLPDWFLYGALILGMIPVIWATVWTAGRAWHVERRLAQNLDIDVPVYKLGYYFKR
jgi:hypothetical protein